MAPSLGRKNLTCFYCNQKSGIKYDGLITQWECGACEAMNYLDDKGEIVDPPVATEYAAPNGPQYAIPRPDSPSSQASDSALFCSTCLKNQHIYTSSLAQYHIETDPNHPQYKELERASFEYRKRLEKQYPQVCEDCEPRVLERMKQAGRTAKTDYLGRLMDKSRARKINSGINDFSISGTLRLLGQLLWYIGFAGQVFWNIIGLLGTLQPGWLTISNPVLSSALLSLISGLSALSIDISTSSGLARPSLICSSVSIWWNPMFEQMNKGFMNHIKGFDDWYKYQGILLLARGLFLYIMGTGVLADPSSAATRGAHLFMLGFTGFVSIPTVFGDII
jgi:hypothetical protein